MERDNQEFLQGLQKLKAEQNEVSSPTMVTETCAQSHSLHVPPDSVELVHNMGITPNLAEETISISQAEVLSEQNISKSSS